MSEKFNYTDKNLRICDDDYKFLSQMYSDIRDKTNTTYTSFIKCMDNVTALAIKDGVTHDNLVNMLDSVRKITDAFEDIKKLSVFCLEYIDNIEDKDESLYQASDK